MISLPPIRRPAAPPLRFRLVLPWLFLLFCLLASVGGWLGWYDPSAWSQFRVDWGNPAIVLLVYASSASILAIALYWVVKNGAIDLLSLWLGQEALGLFGYFYLDQTAAYVPQSETAILGISALLVLIAAVGYAFFFFSVGTTWGLTRAFRFPLTPLPAPPDDLDRRLLILCRLLSLYCLFAIALPMALSGSIPLLSEAGSQSRLEFANVSDAGRALYNLGTALLPFILGCLTVSIFRRPRRIFGWDGICAVTLSVAQLLTSNRAPLMFGLAVAISLLSFCFRWPRWLLVVAYLGYLFAVVFLGGFTSLLRTHPRSLLEPDWFTRSMESAYLGDNIIDVRDGSWVFSNWDFRPLLGETYLGGLVSMVPSGVFPQKKQWNIGLIGVRMVGMSDTEHLGLRVTSFGESFLNFGWLGVVFLGTAFGAVVGILRRKIQLAGAERRCLWWSLLVMIGLRCAMTMTNTGDAFTFWGLAGFLGLIWLFVTFPAKRYARLARQGGKGGKDGRKGAKR